MLTDKQKQELDAKFDINSEVSETAEFDSYWIFAKMENGDIYIVPRYENLLYPSNFSPYETTEKHVRLSLTH